MLNAAALAAASILALAAAPPAPIAPVAPVAPPAPHSIWSYDDGPQEIPASLDWQVRPSDSKDATPGQIDFEIGYHSEHHSSMMGQTMALSSLSGLTESQLASEGQPVSFTVRHDAGDFRCKGAVSGGRGIGTCVYAANPQFSTALAKRGVVGALEPYQQFQLAMTDIGMAYLDELKREAYVTPTTVDLVRAGLHGAGMKQLLAMDAAGYRFGDVPTLVRVRDHGVSARYIGELKVAGYIGLTAEGLVKLRDHGVSASYIAELRKAGYAKLTADDLVRLRDHGVSAAFVAELHAMGYDALPADQLTRLRDHGISAGFIKVANQSGERLSPDDLIRLRESGGRPDRRTAERN